MEKRISDEEREKAMQMQKARLDKLKSAFEAVALTSAGVEVFKEIFRRSGYRLANRYINAVSQTIDVNGMILNEGRRSLWVELRDFLPKKTLREVEV